MGRSVDWKGAVFKYACLFALLLGLTIIVVLLYDVITGAFNVLGDRGLDFLTSGSSKDPDAVGIWQAIKGSFWIAVIVVLVAFPLGIGSAIYLEEYASRGWFTRLVDVTTRNLAGVPSIVYGILGFTVFVKALEGFTGGRSVIAGGLTLGVLVLPIVIITSAEALRAVPNSIREAGFGVGASRWEVVRKQVLPYAAPGILTGTILSLARALGEAAPLILVGAKTGFFALGDDAGFTEEFTGPFTALPNSVFDWAAQPGEEWRAITAAGILVMLVVVLTANAGAILLRNRYEKKRVQ
jgi:phosphate transport system permease protein